MRKTSFALGEWYHCYNRGVDKRTVFQDKQDHYRFLEQLYLGNSSSALHRSNIRREKFTDILKLPQNDPLVAIGAFCLMPNHYHLLLKETREGGITKFMQKLGTAYTMYFNEKNSRIGNLFVKPFRSQYVGTDRYFQYLINYIHCNPAEFFEPEWKSGGVNDVGVLIEKLKAYPYSSLKIYENKSLPTCSILDRCVFKITQNKPARTMIREAQEYYRENPKLP